MKTLRYTCTLVTSAGPRYRCTSSVGPQVQVLYSTGTVFINMFLFTPELLFCNYVMYKMSLLISAPCLLWFPYAHNIPCSVCFCMRSPPPPPRSLSLLMSVSCFVCPQWKNNSKEDHTFLLSLKLAPSNPHPLPRSANAVTMATFLPFVISLRQVKAMQMLAT